MLSLTSFPGKVLISISIFEVQLFMLAKSSQSGNGERTYDRRDLNTINVRAAFFRNNSINGKEDQILEIFIKLKSVISARG